MIHYPPKTTIVFCSLFIAFAGHLVDLRAAEKPAERLRTVQTIDRHWTFNYFPQAAPDETCAEPGYNDAKWPAIAVPHTWNTYETTRELHPFIRSASEKDDPYWWEGWGWYRKRFLPGKELAEKNIFIEFDAVMAYCRVYLNGKLLGEHNGGYSTFSFDLTPELRLGEENVLAVCVSNNRRHPNRIPPMHAGNTDVFGGIYREVRLVVKDRLHIPFQGSHLHEGGTFITTPQVSQQAGNVRVRTWVKNDYPEPQMCMLATTLRDAEGNPLETLRATHRIEPGETYCFDQTSSEIKSPRLWSPESPYVYSVHSQVCRGETPADEYESPFGFRWFAWNYEENRFYLNGKKVHVHGTNRVQDFPWVGEAMPKWMLVRDMRDIRFNLNHNFIRGSVNPQDPLFYDLCDRYGILAVESVPNIKKIDFSEEVQKAQLQEMIRRDRNHPSIVIWSMGNETDDAADSAWARQEDPTRIINARHITNDSAGKFAPHTHENMDFEELLRCTVRGWPHAGVKNYEPANCQQAGHEEWQHRLARVQDASQRGRIDMPNGLMWMYADSGADREYKNCPLKHINPKGWVDLYRVPKYMYYLWQANYLERPMVFIHPHYWQRKYAGEKKEIVVDSNCEQVELFAGGKSRGVLHPNAENFHTVTFGDVPIEPAALVVKGRKGNQEVTSQVVMAGEPAKIVLTASHEKVAPAQDSIVEVTADVVDAAGVRVQGFSQTLRWSVEGSATLVGPAIYESDIDKKEGLEGTMYIVTPVPNLIRCKGHEGTITVRVESEGLARGEIRIDAAAPPKDAAALFAEPVPALSASRKPVERLPLPSSEVNSPGSIELLRSFPQDIQLKAGLKRDEYATAMRRYLKKQNPGIEHRPAEFERLVSLFAAHLERNGGLLVADDSNFIIEQSNDRLAFQFKQRERRSRLAKMLGIPEKHPPLEAQSRGQREHDGLVIEKWLFTSEPGSRVPALLYRKKDQKCRMPAIVLTYGHGGSKSQPDYQYLAQVFAKMGIAVLAIDPLGEEERHEKGQLGTRAHDSLEADRAAWKAGRPILGKLLWDAMRGVDFLLARDDIDPARLGVAGNSLGGALAGWMAVLEPRLHCAVVSGWAFDDSLLHYGKNCTRLPNEHLRKICTWPEYLALSAPHCSILVMNGDADVIIDQPGNGGVWRGTRQNVAEAEIVFTREGNPGGISAWFEPGGGHRPYPAHKAALKWLVPQIQPAGWTPEQVDRLPDANFGQWASHHQIKLERLYGTPLHLLGATVAEMNVRPLAPQDLACLRKEELGDPDFTLGGWLKRITAEEANAGKETLNAR